MWGDNMINLSQAKVFVGTGGVGSGIFFKFKDHHTLGRNESRAGILYDWDDYCKLHIITHYFAALNRGKGTLKVKILPVGKVGNDENGNRLIKQMSKMGMDLSYITTTNNAPTLFSVCFIYPDSTGGNITADNSASGLVVPGDIIKVETELSKFQGKGIALAVPEIPLESRFELLYLATKYRFFRAASFTTGEIRTIRAEKVLQNLDLLALNVDEAIALIGLSQDQILNLPIEDIKERIMAGGSDLAKKYNPNICLSVTLGSKGSLGYYLGNWEYTPSLKVDAINTAGAGDAYLAGVLTGLYREMPFINNPVRQREKFEDDLIVSACDLGTVVASLSVTSPHTIHPNLDASSVNEFIKGKGLKLKTGEGELV